ALRGRLLPYFDTVFNLVHVDDVAAGHLLAWERGRPGESYLLGGENVTVGGVLRLVAELAGGQAPLRLRLPSAVVLAAAWTAGLWGGITGREPPLSAAEVRQAQQPVLYSSGLARQELGYHPRPLPETLADAIHWFRQEQCIFEF
ncbi:MAG: NAD-dependent dehydratase, partial [Desulfuromonadales bacterium]|nr:NAD-dependent dehydratase [Desulfuromonadales bacterium]